MKSFNLGDKTYYTPLKARLDCLVDAKDQKIFEGRIIDEDILRLLARAINLANMYPDWVYWIFKRRT